MKSTIFDGIKERLAEIKREEDFRKPHERRLIGDEGTRDITPQDINAANYEFEQIRKAMIERLCPTYGHDIGLSGCCINCGFKP